MQARNTRFVWIAPIFLALAMLACNGGAPKKPTAVASPPPTQRPVASATAAPAEPTGTELVAAPTEPEATAVPTEAPPQPTGASPSPAATAGSSSLPLSSQPYVDQLGAFSINLPKGWTVQTGNFSVYASSPDQAASIYISYIHVGAQLDPAAMDRLIQASEDNWFGTFPDYSAQPNKTEPDGSILVSKTLTKNDGTHETVFSYYQEDGHVVYEQDYWVDSTAFDQYAQGLVDVANTLKTDPASGEKAKAYAVVYKFTDANKLFAFDVPYAWTHNTAAGDSSQIEIFTSPDELSSVENTEYNSGTPVAPAQAGTFAQSLLKQYLEIDDLKIVDDSPQPDGSERLTWSSAAKGIEGQSFYESRGATFLLLTWMADNADADFFEPVWHAVVTSYQAPKP